MIVAKTLIVIGSVGLLVTWSLICWLRLRYWRQHAQAMTAHRDAIAKQHRILEHEHEHRRFSYERFQQVQVELYRVAASAQQLRAKAMRLVRAAALHHSKYRSTNKRAAFQKSMEELLNAAGAVADFELALPGGGEPNGQAAE